MASHQSYSKLSSAQLSVRLKTCHCFLYDQQWLPECRAVKSRDQNFHGVQMSLNHYISSVWCCTVGQMSWWGCTDILFMPDRVIGVIVIIRPNLLPSLSPSLKMNPQWSFFLFALVNPVTLRCATVVMDLVPLHCTLQMWQLNNSDCQKAPGSPLSADSH